MNVKVTAIWYPPGHHTFVSVEGIALEIPNIHIAEAIEYYLSKKVPLDLPPDFDWKGWNVDLIVTKPEERTGNRFKLTLNN